MKTLRSFALAAMILTLGAACEKATYDFTIHRFKIKAGDHFSTDTLGFNQQSLVPGRELTFKARFDDSAIYRKDEVIPGVNKLFGFSDCGDPHTENGARFGWRGDQATDKVQIYAYTHLAGEFQSKSMTAVPLNEAIAYKIEVAGDHYLFSILIDGKVVTETMPRGCAGGTGLKYMNFPYFGGQSSAPHDITIEITH